MLMATKLKVEVAGETFDGVRGAIFSRQFF
jgi:hypothetical protein